MQGYDHEAAVAAFLAKSGTQHYPTVCLARTQASMSQVDRTALRDYEEAREKQKHARRAMQCKPYSPKPTLVESAKKLGPSFSAAERLTATSSIITMMNELVLLGATFVVIADNLNGNEILNTIGHEWTSSFARKFFRQHSRAQA